MARQQNTAAFWKAAGLALAATLTLTALVLVHFWRLNGDWSIEYRRIWLHAAFGTHGAIAILAAAWVLFGPGRLSTRFAAMFAWMLLLLLLPWRPYFRSRFHLLSADPLMVAVVSLGTWLGTIVLMAAARRFGIRLVDASGQPVADDRRNWQFSILGMLAVTTDVALGTAIFRVMYERRAASWEFTYDDGFWMLVRILNCVLVASTVVTCFHVERPWWRNVLLAAAFVAAITTLHVGAINQYARYFPLMSTEDAAALWGTHYTVVLIWLLAAVGLLHASGYHLRRCILLDNWRHAAVGS